jgi:hypothetical protein
MDAHFNEYLAAVAGMQNLYGESACDREPGPCGESPDPHAGELTAPAPLPILA